MIKRAPFMFSQYTFYVLLVSLFLQNCFTKTKDAAGGHPDLIQQIVTCQLLAREFTTQEGHTVTFCKQRGEISATVKINEQKGNNKAYGKLPVYIAQDIGRLQIPDWPKSEQHKFIYINLDSQGRPYSVAVYKLGVAKGRSMSTQGSSRQRTDIISQHQALRRRLKKQTNISAKRNVSIASLHQAIISGNIKIAKILIHQGLDVNARDENGVTLLHIAALSNQEQLARLLLKRGGGADPNLKASDGLSALHMAVNNHDMGIVKLLLKKGAEVNARCNDGWTPLHGACCDGNIQLASLLIENGADTSAINRQGLIPILLATKNGHSELVYRINQREKG
jgi:hypothetical protein